jgi:hypothetical protein
MYKPSPLKEFPVLMINGQLHDFSAIDREFKASLCRMLNNGMTRYLLSYPEPFTDPKSILDKNKIRIRYAMTALRFQKLYNSNFMTKTDTPPHI